MKRSRTSINVQRPYSYGMPALGSSFLGTIGDAGLNEFPFWALLMPGDLCHKHERSENH